jgi:hypothetical protein
MESEGSQEPERIRESPRPCETLRNMRFIYGDELLDNHPNHPKMESIPCQLWID